MRVKGGARVVSLTELEERRREREDARRAAAEFAGEQKTTKKRTKTIGDSAFMKTMEQVAEMLKADKWGEATGRHFVALYVDLYFRVYGILPEDLGPKERVFASKLASTMLSKQFQDDRAAMSKFMAWTWTEEKRTEQWRRENNREGGIIDWRYQFSTKLVQKYRVSQARKAAGR